MSRNKIKTIGICEIFFSTKYLLRKSLSFEKKLTDIPA